MKKKIIFLSWLGFFSGCLQEASFIENHNVSNANNSFNPKNNIVRSSQDRNSQSFSDENYSNDYKNYNTTQVNEGLVQDEEISWNNIFEEYPEQKSTLKKKNKFNESESPKNLNSKEKDLKKENNHSLSNNLVEKKINKDINKNNINNNDQQQRQKKLNQSLNSNPVKKNLDASSNKQSISEKSLNKISRPINGHVITKYGKNAHNDLNEGVSFKASSENIFACSGGRVIYLDSNGHSSKTIIIKFDNGIVASYVYNGESFVENNSIVKNRQIIGKINMEHGKNILYFTIRENGKLINPEKVIE